MSEWYDSQKNQAVTSVSCCKNALDKANPRRTLTAEEAND